MTEMITRCPKCSTAFRISEVHLKSAKGVVRCGSCLNIFDARAHIEPPKGETKAENKAATNHKKTKSQAKPSAEATDDLFPKESSEPELPLDTKPAPEESNLFDINQETPEPDEAPDEDESWALELLKEEGHAVEPNQAQKKPSKPVVKQDKPQQQAPQKREKTPEAAAPKEAPPQEYATKKHKPASESFTEKTVAPKNTAEKKARAPAVKKAKAIKAGQTEEPSYNEVLASIEPAPVEVEWDGESGRNRKALWLAASLFAAILLVAQIAWMGFHRFNKEEPYRSFYQMACGVIGCTLPPLQDHAKITASNLIVRSHPEFTNALQVDVILQNNATFEQPFPKIVLEFNDSRNKPVFARKFSPDEYLGGELSGQSMMPVKHPIHIAFEIKDPGESAFGYQILISK